MPIKLPCDKIPRFLDWGSYQIDVMWRSLERQLDHYRADYGLDLDPDFQRAHVWTEAQQKDFVEFMVRGGRTGRVILFNAKGWNGSMDKVGPLQLVDGKQRLNAVLRFLHDEITIFDGIPGIGPTLCSELEVLRDLECRFQFYINGLNTKAEVLTWYLQLNAGGTPHTEDELDKVRSMRAIELMDLQTGDIVELVSGAIHGEARVGPNALPNGQREVQYPWGTFYFAPADLKLIRRAK